MLATNTITNALQALETFMRLFETKESFIQHIKRSIANVDQRVLEDMQKIRHMAELRKLQNSDENQELADYDREVARINALLVLEKENVISNAERSEMHELLERHYLLKCYHLNKLTQYRKDRLDTLRKIEKERDLSSAEKSEKERLEAIVESAAGLMSGRVLGYKLPEDQSPKKMQEIKEFREYIASLKYTPDDAYEIEGFSTSAWQKPLKVECYNITRQSLQELGERKFHAGEVIKYASIHGASHSIAMIVTLINEGFDVDFYYHANLEMEMDNELDYVRYVLLNVLKDKHLPLVIVSRGESLHDCFYHHGAFPTIFKRWCSEFFKIAPLKALLHDLWDHLVYDDVPLGDRSVENRKAKLETIKAKLDTSGRLDDASVDRMFKLKQRKNAKSERNKATEAEIEEYTKLDEIWQDMTTEKQLMLEVEHKKEFTRNFALSQTWRGESLVVMQYIGIQQHQSTGRKKMNPTAVVSDMTDKDLIVFDTLPVFKPYGELTKNKDYDPAKPETFNKLLINSIGAQQNPNETEMGRHGCLVCPFAGPWFFEWLKNNRPDLHAKACMIRDWSNEKYGDPAKGNYIVYRLGKEISKTAIREYEERTGKKLTESPF
jgi:hypothetical protein